MHCFCLLFCVGEDFDEVGADLGGYGGDAFELDDDAFGAGTLHFHEDAFDAVERAAVDAHVGASADVEIIGGEEERFLFARLGQGDEVVHLLVGHGDDAVFSASLEEYVLQESVFFKVWFQLVLVGTHEDEVADGRFGNCGFSSLDGLYFVCQRDEAFDAVVVERGFYGHLVIIERTHGVPSFGGVVCFCGHVCWSGFMGGSQLVYVHTFESLKLV